MPASPDYASTAFEVSSVPLSLTIIFGLPRSKASIIYKATGNLRAVQILLGHAKIDSTVRYLGVDVEDALELAERTKV
jgi:hypothetical protein